MKVSIEDNCYIVVRVVNNGTSLDKEFLERCRDNKNADTMISDQNGNILICKKTIDCSFNEELKKWTPDNPRNIEIIEDINPVKTKQIKRKKVKRNKRK